MTWADVASEGRLITFPKLPYKLSSDEPAGDRLATIALRARAFVEFRFRLIGCVTFHWNFQANCLAAIRFAGESSVTEKYAEKTKTKKKKRRSPR